MKLNAKDYEYFKKALLDQKAGLLNEANKTVESELGVKNEELSDTIDRSTVETDRNFTLRLRDRERKLLKKVEEALDRLEKGELGDCIQCDKRIGISRLKARPVATLCIDCKEEQEQKESQFG
ncbi:RNA polymerase-binding transcription factor DksA [hydrothermal vent metagenome]|uniref:RNA polymerase-binding transcription factor DksA n=1 Tax=hydrothermal vent metagenome TaxID=652676 RepID=A0A3B1BNC4_9ZZZZ